MDSLQLQAWKKLLLDLISLDKIDLTLEHLKDKVPDYNTSRYGLIISISQNYERIKTVKIKGTQNFDDLLTQENRLIDRLLSLVNDLSIKDFEVPGAGTSTAENTKSGTVLYAIPDRMGVNDQTECIVRLAFDKALIEEGLLVGAPPEIRQIRRIEDKMEVELVDPSGAKFSIYPNKSTRQIVERDSYAEWVFWIQALQEGIHTLFLKISAVIMLDGQRETIEMVLTEKIQVLSTHEQPRVAGQNMKASGLIFTFGIPQLPLSSHKNEQDKSVTQHSSSEIILSKIAAIAGGVATIGGILWWLNSTPPTNQIDPGLSSTTENLSNDSVSFHPPIAGQDVPFEVYQISGGRDTTLNTTSGGQIFIPANSLVDQNKQVITGPIEVRIREIDQPSEIIRSGVSMRYFNAQGHESWMRTSGMFEIRAFLNGIPIFIAENHQIKISLVSNDNADCEFWKFQNQNWVNLGKAPTAELLTNDQQHIQSELKTLDESLKTPLKAPIKSTTRHYSTAGIRFLCCPELKKQGAYLHFACANLEPRKSWDADPEFIRLDNAGKWDRIYLVEQVSEVLKTYKLKFQSEDPTITPREFTVTLAENAELSYQKAKLLFDSLSRDRSAKTERRIQIMNTLDQQQSFRRSINVNSFGLYNYDILLKYDDLVAINANFDIQGSTKAIDKSQITVYLISEKNRTVISYPYSNWSNFKYSPSQDNKLVALIPGEGLAYVKNREFKNAPHSPVSYTFNMVVAKESDDLEKVLSLASE